jgi:hypothetical protein
MKSGAKEKFNHESSRIFVLFCAIRGLFFNLFQKSFSQGVTIVAAHAATECGGLVPGGRLTKALLRAWEKRFCKLKIAALYIFFPLTVNRNRRFSRRCLNRRTAM